MAEYAIIAAALALPMLAIGAILATSSGAQLSNMNSNMTTLTNSPP